jgi:hypothetical protein
MRRQYRISLVGTQFYQRAVGPSKAGEAVDILLEPDNPDDPQALVVKNRSRPPRTIGYIPRDLPVHAIVREEGLGLAGTIEDVPMGSSGFFEVRLLVSVMPEPPGSASWEPDDAVAWRTREPEAFPSEPGDLRKRDKAVFLAMLVLGLYVCRKVLL